jgi:hypothetical protein
VKDYKKDADKAPVLDALLPFYPALEALARMMVDSAKKHELEGVEDPFNQWRKLPNAKIRLANAAGRHILKGPWTLDADSGHLHMAHALFGVLSSLTLHQEAERATKYEPVASPDLPQCHSVSPMFKNRCELTPGHRGDHRGGDFVWHSNSSFAR